MFFLSLFIILILSVFFKITYPKIKLPPLLGYLILGIVIGPFCLSLIDPKILRYSKEIRQVALILIIIRAGLNLDINKLKKIGRPALLISFLPSVFEITLVGIFAPLLFKISYLESFLMGSILGAVSPAVIVPKMIDMIKKKKSPKKQIPELILAGASVDDVFAILIFTSLLNFSLNKGFKAIYVINMFNSIILGIEIGIVVGFLLSTLFKKIHINNILKTIIVFSVCFLFYIIESNLKNYIGFSSLLATLACAMTLLFKTKKESSKIENNLKYMWIILEMFLFILVGAKIKLDFLMSNFIYCFLIVVIGLIGRSLGVFIALIKTKYNIKEKIFINVSYLPKATVQAAIGAIPLTLGLASGNLIVTTAVISILLTAPLGAILINILEDRLVKE